MEENTKITVYKRQADVRLIDFQIALKALTTGVEIGGSKDPKGYGGFSTRIKLPDDLLFTSMDKQITPQVMQVEAGPWMDFSGSITQEGKISGISILCHPNTPNYPAPWILRAKGSMQNIVFPGQERVKIPNDIPTILKYRLVVHSGSATDVDISELYNQYLAGNTY